MTGLKPRAARLFSACGVRHDAGMQKTCFRCMAHCAKFVPIRVFLSGSARFLG